MIRSYSSLLFWLGMTIAASLMLYHTSDKVHALDVQLGKLNAQIEDEQKSLHILKAEWAYLTNPTRIETEARRYLNMGATAPSRMAALRNLESVLPLQDGTVSLAQADDPANAPQAASPQTATAPGAADRPGPTAKPDPAPRTKRDRVLATLNAGRINDHVKMQHAAPQAAATDKIGVLIGQLGLNQ